MQALLCGYYGEHNLGDDALLEALLAQMPSGWSALVTAWDEAAVQERHGVATVQRRGVGGVLRALDGCDALVFGGGQPAAGLHQLPQPPLLRRPGVKARWQGKPVLLWGQGLGPLRRRRSRALVGLVLPRVTAMSWRDPDSAGWPGNSADRGPPAVIRSGACRRLPHRRPSRAPAGLPCGRSCSAGAPWCSCRAAAGCPIWRPWPPWARKPPAGGVAALPPAPGPGVAGAAPQRWAGAPGAAAAQPGAGGGQPGDGPAGVRRGGPGDRHAAAWVDPGGPGRRSLCGAQLRPEGGGGGGGPGLPLPAAGGGGGPPAAAALLGGGAQPSAAGPTGSRPSGTARRCTAGSCRNTSRHPFSPPERRIRLRSGARGSPGRSGGRCGRRHGSPSGWG